MRIRADPDPEPQHWQEDGEEVSQKVGIENRQEIKAKAGSRQV